MRNSLKPALSFEDQLNHLIDKKLIIHNKKNALFILKHENYYRLSGYMIDFLDENDEFGNEISFEDIYNIYKTDKEMRSTLYELINDIEVYLKTQIANYFGLKYGPDGYRNPFNFGDYKSAIGFINNSIRITEKNKNTLIVKHHNEDYGGVLPIWALVELLSFGDLSRFYSFMTNEDKKAICSIGYNDVNYIKLESFYHAMVFFRNQCCHYQRLYNIAHIIKPVIYETDFYPQVMIKNNSTFYHVYVLLLMNPNEHLGSRAIYKIGKMMEKSKIDFCKKYGFPTNWKSILHKANGHCINN